MEKHWYTLQVYVGFEKRVKAVLQQKLQELGHQDSFGEIIIPTEQVIDLVRGKKQTIERRLFPGYVFVEMAFTDTTWHLVHSVPRIVGFIGESEMVPTPLAAEQVARIKQQMESTRLAPRPRMVLTIGDKVKVTDGPFRDFAGVVEAVKPERSRVRVAVTVFGRATPVELDFLQVEAA
ncbi:MAG: transcription termination/antitermination protein NusG [Deltaproteobacteria bacterium]|nr:transcription termination/antitermination protein NusG [Deltaproteobacteria bacterium]